MKAKDLSVKIKVDTSEIEGSMARMEEAVARMSRLPVPGDRAIPLALLGAYAAGTQLRRPMSRRSLLMGGLR